MAREKIEPAPVAAYQGGRQIVASGTMVVTPGAAPLVLTGEGAALVIHFDVVKPFKRPDGIEVGGRHDANSIGPDETKTAALGSLTATYTLHPYRPDVLALDGAGRHAPSMYLLLWEVSRDAPGMAIPAPALPDYRMPSRNPDCFF